MTIVCDNAYHDRGIGVCSFCVQKRIDVAVTAERQRVILALEEYGRTDMTLSRLGELLDQSPPVLRILIARANDRFRDSAVRM